MVYSKGAPKTPGKKGTITAALDMKNIGIDGKIYQLIDEQVDQIQQVLQPFIGNLMMQREALMKRAQDEDIKEDAGAVLIETEGKKNRNEIEDLDTFELQFPGKLQKIRDEQKRKITVKYEKDVAKVPDSPVPLGVADEIVGKDLITEFVGYQPVKVTYQVQRR